MQNRQNGRRRRGGGNNVRSIGGPQNNRLEVRVRGNAHQLLEKYRQLARDAHQSGDRVAAEYYLQHADHYFRVLNDGRIRQEEVRARRGVFDPLDEDVPGDEAAELADGDDGAGLAYAPGRESGQRDGRDSGQRDSGQRDSGQREAREAMRPAPRPAQAPRPADLAPQVLELHLSDGEAALAAFGGSIERPVAGANDADMDPAEEAAAPARRVRPRGRPRKAAAAPDPGLLPK